MRDLLIFAVCLYILKQFLVAFLDILGCSKKKSSTRETLNLSTDAHSSTITMTFSHILFFFGQKYIIFDQQKKSNIWGNVMVMVLLPGSVERFSVSRVRNFLEHPKISKNATKNCFKMYKQTANISRSRIWVCVTLIVYLWQCSLHGPSLNIYSSI